MGSSLWERLLPEAMRVHRFLALEKVRGDSSLESISWEPNQKKNKRWCVLYPDLPCRIPGDGRARQLQKDYTPCMSPQRHASWKNTPEKNSSSPQPCEEGALGEAL